ncbi:MAG: hypothetical protein HY286_01955 [Planctomycetes bacterium]|nr:hypothetical protein [Planctomycetota bacterium]
MLLMMRLHRTTLVFATLAMGVAIPQISFSQEKGGGGQEKIGGVDLRDLAKQAAIARESIKALPIVEAEWPAILVNGIEVPSQEVARTSIYVSGDSSMAVARVSVAVEKELARRKAANEDVTAYQVDEKGMRARLDDYRKQVEEKKPDITFEQHLATSGQTEASFEFALRTQDLFDAVYLPKKGAWPQVTIEAVKALRPGLDPKQFNDFLFNLQQQNSADDGRKQGNVLGLVFLRQAIAKHILEPLELKDELDGIPQDTALMVADREFKTQEILKKGMGLGVYPDSLKTIQFAAVREAVKQAILAREESDWVKAREEAKKKRDAGGDAADPTRPQYWFHEGSAEFKDAFEAEKRAYPAGPFSLPGMVHFRRFPTMQLYRMYFQMFESFKRMAAAERTDEAIKKYVDEHMLYFTSGTADVEVIWYSYSADASVRSIEEGFEKAFERANKGIADLKEGASRAAKARKEAKDKNMSDADAEKAAIEAARGFTFSDILERDSNYSDPKPAPGQPAPIVTTNHGHFGPQQRQPLIERTHESELTTIIEGYNFAEHMFFDAKVGEVVGPVRGPSGCYVARLVARNPGTKVSDLADAKQSDLARQDFNTHSFYKFVNGVMQKAKVEIRK